MKATLEQIAKLGFKEIPERGTQEYKLFSKDNYELVYSTKQGTITYGVENEKHRTRVLPHSEIVELFQDRNEGSE